MTTGEGYNIPPAPDNTTPPPNGFPPPPRRPNVAEFNYRLLQAFAETTQAAVRNGMGAILSQPIKMEGEDHDPISLVEMIYDLNSGLEDLNENLAKMNELLILQLQEAGVIEDDDDDDEEEKPRRRRKKTRARR